MPSTSIEFVLNSFRSGKFESGVKEINFLELQLKESQTIQVGEKDIIVNNIILISEKNGISQTFKPHCQKRLTFLLENTLSDEYFCSYLEFQQFCEHDD